MLFVIPNWRVSGRYSRDPNVRAVNFNVSEDDLEAFIKTLKRSGFWSLTMEKRDPYPDIGEQVAS